MTHDGTRARRAAGGKPARKAVGLFPYARPKLEEKLPPLFRPAEKQMSAPERSVVRSSAAARSSRRVSRYWCGGSPNARRNSRVEWARGGAGGGGGGGARAAPRGGAVNDVASARSLALRRCRAGGTKATPASIAELVGAS